MNKNHLLDIIQSLYICPTNKLKIERFLAILSLGDKKYLAGNIKFNTDILTIIAKDEDCLARECVAYNIATPIVTLKMLAKDKNSWVRYQVARNPSAPEAALEILANDNDAAVRDKAIENLKERNL